MQILTRRIAPGELDYELIWLSATLGSLGLAASWFALRLPWPSCLFHAITGQPCVTCGATRSAIAFFHGHLFAAWKWNPLIFLFLCSVTVFDLYAFAVLAAHAPRLRIARITSAEKYFVRALVVSMFALNWIYLLSHWREL